MRGCRGGRVRVGGVAATTAATGNQETSGDAQHHLHEMSRRTEEDGGGFSDKEGAGAAGNHKSVGAFVMWG